MITKKAIEIACRNSNTDFKASVGWLSGFNSRHGLKLRKLHGEFYLASEIVSDQFLNDIKTKFLKYEPENIYNTDETEIFFKLIPCKTVQ